MNTVGIFNSITHAAYQLATCNMKPADEPGKSVFDAKEALADAVSKQDTMVKKHAWVTGDAATMPKLGRKW